MNEEDQVQRSPMTGIPNAPYDSQEFGLDSQEFALDSQEFSLDSQEQGLNSQEFAMDSQEFAMGSQEFGNAFEPGLRRSGGAVPVGRFQAGVFAGQSRFGTGPARWPPTTSAEPSRPLRVIHVGQHMVRAGIEMWLKALVKFSDPNRIRFERCIVTSTFNDPQVIRELPVPVEVGGEASVRRAAADCDVLLVSGPGELPQWLGALRPSLCVFVAHGDGIFTRRILDKCSPVIDHVVAVSRRVQREVCQNLASTVIYNGIDTAHLTRSEPRDNVRARFGFAPDDFVLGSVMRLSPEKRPELLIEAISRLPRKFKLLLVGWGPLQQKLFDLANRIAPARCVITPAGGYLGDYYSAFDAFCLPSDSEGFGLATLEALYCGVPVVTTDSGFAPELLQDRVQYMQCAGNAGSIAQSLTMLDGHPQWASGLAAEGRAAAEQFGFATRMCREYEALLLGLRAAASEARPAKVKRQTADVN